MTQQTRGCQFFASAQTATLTSALAGAACALVADGLPRPGFLVTYMPFSANLDADAAWTIGNAAQAALAEPAWRHA